MALAATAKAMYVTVMRVQRKKHLRVTVASRLALGHACDKGKVTDRPQKVMSVHRRRFVTDDGHFSPVCFADLV